MATKEERFPALLPEIYPIMAAHLPLYATPSTLLALALTNHNISEIVLPLLYSQLILKNEADSVLVLQKLVDDPPFGRVVHELHVMSDLSLETQIQDPPWDVMRRVSDIISKAYLPFIHTLGLRLCNGWYYDDRNNYEPVKGFGQLGKEFWSQLEAKCPRLRALILNGVEDDPYEPWIEESGLLEVPSITSLTIHVSGYTLRASATHKLLRHISSLALSLHTLDLEPSRADSLSTSLIFELNFPCLRSLSLASFTDVDTSQAMAFWERHPSIEYLNIASNSPPGNTRRFAASLPGNFPPKPPHLTVSWKDTLRLAPILGQLLSLSIDDIVNAQIPYLLRSVCPDGLPKLKSLDIGQAPSSTSQNKNIEGSLWYETKDGVFQRSTNKGSRTVFDSFMHSIIRSTPNLMEIGFHGSPLSTLCFLSIAGDLNELRHLKHLYYEEYHYGEDGSRIGRIPLHWRGRQDTFASQAMKLAEAVPNLVSITKVATLYLPYMVARIARGENSEVTSVEVGNGYGMKIGYEDEAFPWAPHSFN